MEYSDKKILEHKLAVPIGKAINDWLRENDLQDVPVVCQASVVHPSLYVDENGVSHTGHVALIDVEIDDDDDD